MESIEGLPFYHEGLDTYAVFTGGNKDLKTFIYLDKNGLYHLGNITVKDNRLPPVNRSAYNALDISVKVIDIDASNTEFGMSQRRNDFKFSVLRIVDYFNSERNRLQSLILLTGREDSVTISMLFSEVKFVYPIISGMQTDLNGKRLKSKDKVVAIKNDNCNLFKKGDIFIVKNVVKDNFFAELDVITFNEKNKKEIISYAKNFKLIK